MALPNLSALKNKYGTNIACGVVYYFETMYHFDTVDF
jgi:hypothetical protein